MENETDPLAHFGLDAIDLRRTLKDIAAKRSRMINKQHLAQLIDLGLVEMREDAAWGSGVTEFSDATVVQPDIVSVRQKVRASLDASLPGWCRARQYSADVW